MSVHNAFLLLLSFQVLIFLLSCCLRENIVVVNDDKGSKCGQNLDFLMIL